MREKQELWTDISKATLSTYIKNSKYVVVSSTVAIPARTEFSLNSALCMSRRASVDAIQQFHAFLVCRWKCPELCAGSISRQAGSLNHEGFGRPAGRGCQYQTCAGDLSNLIFSWILLHDPDPALR